MSSLLGALSNPAPLAEAAKAYLRSFDRTTLVVLVMMSFNMLLFTLVGAAIMCWLFVFDGWKMCYDMMGLEYDSELDAKASAPMKSPDEMRAILMRMEAMKKGEQAKRAQRAAAAAAAAAAAPTAEALPAAERAKPAVTAAVPEAEQTASAPSEAPASAPSEAAASAPSEATSPAKSAVRKRPAGARRPTIESHGL